MLQREHTEISYITMSKTSAFENQYCPYVELDFLANFVGSDLQVPSVEELEDMDDRLPRRERKNFFLELADFLVSSCCVVALLLTTTGE